MVQLPKKKTHTHTVGCNMILDFKNCLSKMQFHSKDVYCLAEKEQARRIIIRQQSQHNRAFSAFCWGLFASMVVQICTGGARTNTIHLEIRQLLSQNSRICYNCCFRNRISYRPAFGFLRTSFDILYKNSLTTSSTLSSVRFSPSLNIPLAHSLQIILNTVICTSNYVLILK